MKFIMKIWVISKKTGVLCVLAVLLLISLLYISKERSIEVANAAKDLPIYCVDKGEEKVVALSFDAAWGNEDTQNLIDIMNKYNVKPTFFVVGGWVDNFPESVKALSDAGHEIMNHSNTHPHMTQISTDKMKEEVTACDEKIRNITGVTPTLFRAPYGDYNNQVVQAMRETGHYTIQWDVDSLDWKNLSASEIFERVTSKVQPGSIVLFHNAALHTPEALPNIIEKLQSDGYKIVPVSEIIMKENFKVDSTGRQISAEPTSSAEPSNSTAPSNSTKPINSTAPTNSAEPTSSTEPSSSAEPSNSTQPTSDAQVSETPSATEAPASENPSTSASTVSKIPNN